MLQNPPDIFSLAEEEKVILPTIPPFEIIWSAYPKRVGKAAALRHYEATVKSEEDAVSMGIALRNYVESGNVKRGYVQNGSTWFNDWRGWVDPTPEMMKGNANGSGQASTLTQGGRAAFNPSSPEQLEKLRNLTESLRERDRARSERTGSGG